MLKKLYIHSEVEVRVEDGKLEFVCEACGRKLPGIVAPFPCRGDEQRYFLVHGDVGYAFAWTGERLALRAIYLKDYGSYIFNEGKLVRTQIYTQPWAEEPLLQMARTLLPEGKPLEKGTLISIPQEAEEYLESLIETGAVSVQLVPVELTEEAEGEDTEEAGR